MDRLNRRVMVHQTPRGRGRRPPALHAPGDARPPGQPPTTPVRGPRLSVFIRRIMSESSRVKKTPRLRCHARGLNIPTALLKSFHPSLLPEDDYSIQTLVDRRHAADTRFRRQAHSRRRRARTARHFLQKFRRARTGVAAAGSDDEPGPARWPAVRRTLRIAQPRK